MLEEVAELLSSDGRRVTPIVADVTRDEDVERLVQQTIERAGRLDVLVNNVGRSMRGLLLETTAEQFQQQLELNLLAAVRCTRFAAPHLVATRGHVVNIGSLAAKSAGRYLGAYSASKFALAGYTQQLRLELAEQGVHVLLACPGPIARESPRPGDENDSEAANLPERARLPGGGVRTKQLNPNHVAAAIVRACQHRRAELILPAKARILFTLAQLSPRLGDWLVRKFT